MAIVGAIRGARGRRDWSKEPDAQAPVYGNRRRIRGRRGRRLMRQRGERVERSFAHLYDTSGMRRTRLRGHARNRPCSGRFGGDHRIDDGEIHRLACW